MTALIVIIVVAVVIFGLIVSVYNKLIGMIEEVNNNERQIDIQLDRRFKVFQSLIETVKKYMDYEQTTLKDVVALRNQAQEAKTSGDQSARIAAENGISKIASGINVVFEQYPDLKANQNALQLQEEIVSTENKLSFAKQAFNDSIERYNAYKKSFFQGMVVNMFRAALDKTFTYWQLSKDDAEKKEDYSVKF
jgi:LemA protein